MTQPHVVRVKPQAMVPMRVGFKRCGFSISTGLRLMKRDPTFPVPIAFNGPSERHRWAFHEHELDAWIAARPRMAILPPLVTPRSPGRPKGSKTKKKAAKK